MTEQDQNIQRIFASDEARRGWEINQKVERLNEIFPSEGQQLKAKPILFEKEFRHDGLAAIFAAGTVIGTGIRGVLLVPERSLKILEELQIPYQIYSHQD